MTPDEARKRALEAAREAFMEAVRTLEPLTGPSREPHWRAALDAYERALWQPIATAPPDEVEVYVPASRYRENQVPAEGWVGQSAPGDMLRQEATHWRPLSARPGEGA